MNLYKYLPPARFDVLEKLHIRFSPALSVNDAFELRPLIKGWASEEQVRDTLVSGLRSNFQGADTPEKMLKMITQHDPEAEAKFRATMEILGPEEWLRRINSFAQQNFEGEAAKLHSVIEQNWESVSAGYTQKLLTQIGILSLSEDSQHHVMWGNYTDSSRGLVIGFDERHPWFHRPRSENDDFFQVKKVTYLEENPKFFMELTADDVLYSKQQVWSYEKEWRMVIPLYHGINTGTLDTFGQPVIVFAFPAACIKEVIIGKRASEELFQRIQDTCKKFPNPIVPSRGNW